MLKNENYLDDDTDSDELRRLVECGQLSRSSVVTADDLRMKTGQTLKEKAKELGCTCLTLRCWHLEWRGSGYDPGYVIRRGPSNTQPGRYKEKDWVAAVREEIARGRARHVGDVMIEVGITGSRAQQWSMRHADFEKVLWHSGVPYPKQHWRDFIAWLRLPTIERYRELKAAYIVQGVPDIDAGHRAADEAVNELKHRVRQWRRVERDQLLGVGGHEEILRRYRGNARLTDAHSRRLGKKLLQVSRWATMERALREVGFPEEDVEHMMAELMGAFDGSKEEGQAQWKNTRQAVLRRRAEAEAHAKAEEVEADVVKGFTERRKRTAPIVAGWAEERYGETRN
jgi:hypothetical protein